MTGARRPAQGRVGGAGKGRHHARKLQARPPLDAKGVVLLAQQDELAPGRHAEKGRLAGRVRARGRVSVVDRRVPFLSLFAPFVLVRVPGRLEVGDGIGEDAV